MPHGIRRPSPAMAVALLALVASTTGVGIAATTLDGAKLKTRSVSTPKLKIGAVRAQQLATGAVTTTKIRARAVTAGKIAPNAITTDAIAPGAVRADDLAPDALGSAQIVDGSILAAEIGPGAVTDGKIANGTISRAKLTADALLPLVAVRRSAEVSIVNATTGTVTANCAPGERATSGGAATTLLATPNDLFMVGSNPIPATEGETPTGWTTTFFNGEPTPIPVVGFAICMRAG